MTTPAAMPLETPFSRVEDLAEAVRAGKPLPPAESSVLQHYANVAGSAGAWEEVAEIIVAAELVDRGFQMHRLASDAGCRRDELLLGDYSLVCAAELATRLGRSDVDRDFARAAMTAAAGENYVPLRESAQRSWQCWWHTGHCAEDRDLRCSGRWRDLESSRLSSRSRAA